MTPTDAPPDMEYAHPGAPTSYKAPPATRATFDPRTGPERQQAEIAALRRELNALKGKAGSLHAEIAALRARIDRQEATD